MRHILGPALFLVLFSIPAKAQTKTEDGNTFLAECTAAVRLLDNPQSLTNDEIFVAGKCANYVNGFRDGYLMAQLASTKDVCMPYEVNTGQLIRVFVKFL